MITITKDDIDEALCLTPVSDLGSGTDIVLEYRPATNKFVYVTCLPDLTVKSIYAVRQVYSQDRRKTFNKALRSIDPGTTAEEIIEELVAFLNMK